MTEKKLKEANELFQKIEKTKKELSILVQSTKILAVTESNASSVNLGTPESQILFNNFKDSLIEILKEKLNILESQFEKLWPEKN